MQTTHIYTLIQTTVLQLVTISEKYRLTADHEQTTVSIAKEYRTADLPNITTPQATCLQVTVKRPKRTTMCVSTDKKLYGPDTNQTSIQPLISYKSHLYITIIATFRRKMLYYEC
jgi:hypothetical protein